MFDSYSILNYHKKEEIVDKAYKYALAGVYV
jgi:hypothetical protein